MHFVDEYGPNFEIGAKEFRHDNEDHTTGRKPEENVSQRSSPRFNRGILAKTHCIHYPEY